MDVQVYAHPERPIVEVQGPQGLIASESDCLRVLESLYDYDARHVILQRAALAPAFFDLHSGLAGAVLQKFVNYRIPVAIVGDFSDLTSTPWKAFIYESNAGSQVFFLPDAQAAVTKLRSLEE